MTTTIELNEAELDYQLFRSLKAMYKNRRIRLIIDNALDETEYLLSSEANKEVLDESIAQLKRGEKILVTLDELRK
jgi:uncharacterized membrane-anchored protein YjiN (DUF445 family)